MNTSDKKFILLAGWALFVLASLTIPIDTGPDTGEAAYGDKLVHFILFAVFAWLLAGLLGSSRITARKTLAARAFGLSLLYAGLGEVWQTQLPYRTASEWDLIAGLAGILTALTIFYARPRT